MNREGLGMTQRELERELKWILRNPPDDTRELVKLLSLAMVTLIGRNNARIAEQMASTDAPDVEEDF